LMLRRARGSRRCLLQSWLVGQLCRRHRLDPLALRNINHPEGLTP